MTVRLRPLLALSLALLIALTGQSMAVMRGMPGPAGVMELCSHSGPTRILVDETGKPVGPPHICPDCTLSLLALHEGAPLDLIPVEGAISQVRASEPLYHLSHVAVEAQARGPPALT